MQDSTKFHDHSEESRIAVVKTTAMAPSLEQIEEIAHSDVFAAADSPKIKVTPRAPKFDAEQAPILAMHWLNPPLQDGLLTVNAIYQEIKKIVIQYQLDHNDAFYEQYPKLAILKDGESLASMTTHELRTKHREFDRRLAHYIWHYHNACCMFIASCANMCVVGHINGPGKYHDLGEAFKIGRINNALNRYASFFKSSHVEDYIIKYSKFATGRTTYGADIVSFPLWVTDVLGNRGCGSVNYAELFDGAQASGDDVNPINPLSNDIDDFTELQKNMDIIRGEFIRDDIVTDPNDSSLHHANRIADKINPLSSLTDARDCTPSMPFIENSATVTASNDNGDSYTVYLGSNTRSGYSATIPVRVGSAQTVTTDNLINRLWDTFNYWLEYLETYFNEFSQPTSEMVKFCQEHGWIDTKTINASALFTRINTKESFDMMSLRDQMLYKRDNSVTTATQIRFMPIVDRYYTSWKDPVDFDRNFNRYHVEDDDPVGIVLNARQYPSLTPEIFHDLGYSADAGENEPHVSNGIICGSTQVDTTQVDALYPVHGILGKYATFLDYASSSHMDAEHTAVEVVALDPEIAKDFIKRGNGIVLSETMDYPRAFAAPLIDNTDPFQCGFNVVMFYNSRTQTEFERWFLDPNRYGKFNTDTDTMYSYTPVTAAKPGCPTYDVDANTKYQQMSLLNPGWREMNRYNFLFVGDAIWYQPENIASNVGAGNYDEEYARGSRESATADILRVISTLNTEISAVKQTTLGDAFNYNSRNATKPETAIAAGLVGSVATRKQYSVKGVTSLSSGDWVQWFFNLFGGTGGQLHFCTFNPLYGAVNIAKYDSPYIGLAMLVGMMGMYADENTTRDPGFLINYCRMGASNGGYYGIGGNIAKVSYDSYRSASQFLLWCIDSISIRKVLRQGRRLYSPELMVAFSGFSGEAKTALALLSRSRIMYTGIEDTYYLNSLPADKQTLKEPDIQNGSTINYGNLVKAPEVKSDRIPQRRSFGFFAKKSMKTAQVSADTYKEARDMRRPEGSDKTNYFDRFARRSGDVMENKLAGDKPKKGGKKPSNGGKPKSEAKYSDEEKIESAVNNNASDSNS